MAVIAPVNSFWKGLPSSRPVVLKPGGDFVLGQGLLGLTTFGCHSCRGVLLRLEARAVANCSMMHKTAPSLPSKELSGSTCNSAEVQDLCSRRVLLTTMTTAYSWL